MCHNIDIVQCLKHGLTMIDSCKPIGGPNIIVLSSSYLTRLCFHCVLLLCSGVLGGLTLESVQVWSRLWSTEKGISLEHLDILSFLSIAYSAGVLFLPWMNSVLPSWIPLTLHQFWLSIALMVLALGCALLSFSYPCDARMLTGIFVCWFGQMIYDTLIVMGQKTALPESLRGIPESFCFNGYRIGMTLAISQGLLLTHHQWRWSQLYGGLSILVCLVLIGFLIYSVTQRKNHTVESSPTSTVSLHDTFYPAFCDLWKRSDFYYFLAVLSLYRGAESIFGPNREVFFVMHGVSKTAHASMNAAAFWWSTLTILISGVCSVRFGVVRVLKWGLIGYSLSLGLLFMNHVYQGACCTWTSLYIFEQAALNFGLTGFFAFQTAYITTRYALCQTACFMAFMNLSMQLLGIRSGWLCTVFGWTGVFMGATFMILMAYGILHYNSLSQRRKKKYAHARHLHY